MMKVIEISDELYDKLKNCVVDPFDDTPESVIGRLIDIVDKAKGAWSPWDAEPGEPVEEAEGQNGRSKQGRSWNKRAETVL